MCGIAAQLSPVPDSSGIQLMHADTFDLHSFQALTGTTFMMVTGPSTTDAPSLLQGTCVAGGCRHAGWHGAVGGESGMFWAVMVRRLGGWEVNGALF